MLKPKIYISLNCLLTIILLNVFPMETQEQKDLFELLDYAYIGARYNKDYAITKEQLEQLAPCVRKLHEVTERICKEKIDSLGKV